MDPGTAALAGVGLAFQLIILVAFWRLLKFIWKKLSRQNNGLQKKIYDKPDSSPSSSQKTMHPKQATVEQKPSMLRVSAKMSKTDSGRSLEKSFPKDYKLEILLAKYKLRGKAAIHVSQKTVQFSTHWAPTMNAHNIHAFRSYVKAFKENRLPTQL
ncbi:hypothetical protein [Motiliproteus sediminis]|uniref:hypothetical protein n=1 Tax=Motiliproteus sediminis TaxID=1468178 RepID=UPI001AEFDB6C|nr:hypothetical protein [Motiliproteus sediminis]